MKIAFYKGKGNWIDKVIRWRARSKYSHCELVFEEKLRWFSSRPPLWFSSSPRDGGARFKIIEPDPNAWNYVDIGGDLDECNKVSVHATQIGKCKYDFIGAIFGVGLGLGVENPRRFFCVEAIAFALKDYMKLPSNVSPQKLYEALKCRWNNSS